MQRYFEIYEVMIKYDGVEVLFREFDQDGRVAFTGRRNLFLCMVHVCPDPICNSDTPSPCHISPT
jgi:hypothetical protein